VSFSSVREQIRQLLEKLGLPSPDLVGVDPVLSGQLGDRFLAFDGLEGDLRLE